MAGCIYMYHIQRLLACLAGGPYDGTVDFNHDGAVTLTDFLFALTNYCG